MPTAQALLRRDAAAELAGLEKVAQVLNQPPAMGLGLEGVTGKHLRDAGDLKCTRWRCISTPDASIA